MLKNNKKIKSLKNKLLNLKRLRNNKILIRKRHQNNRLKNRSKLKNKLL
jgi:hypothetical protein